MTKEALISVRGLHIADKAKNMLDSQWNSYVNSLNMFIDGFPAIATRLRSDLSSASYDRLASSLSDLSGTLFKIHADEIAQECSHHVNMINRKEIDKDEMEAFLENFIQNVSALSIEIQTAERKSASMPPSARPQHRAAPAAKSSKPLILAVDNAVMYLNMLKKLLKDSPYDVHCCETSDDAFTFLDSHRPDAILLDVEMPGDIDGYALARKIRASGQKAPIIFITAHSDREYVDKAMDVGAVGLLVKPLRINQLLAKLEEAI